MAKLFSGPFLPREIDITNGIAIASGYYVKTFEPDGAYTTTKAIYTEAAETTPHANPFQINASGFPTAGSAFWSGLIDYKVYDGDPDSGGNLIKSVRNAGDNNSAIATDLQNLIQNASFETDADSDGDPDNWTLSEHANITIARNATSPGHGGAFANFTVSGAGSATLTSSLFEVAATDTLVGGILINGSVATFDVTVTLIMYDEDQAATGNTQDIYSSTNNPTSWAEIRFAPTLISAVDSNARYCALRITVDDNGQTGTVGFDGSWLTVRRLLNAPMVPYGLVVSRDAGDTDHDLNITAGAVKADDGIYDLILDTEITKQIDGTWVAGDDQTGAEAAFAIPSEDLLYIWLIGNSTSGAVDVLISNSGTSPTTPSGWDKKRRIFAWPCDSSNNLVDGFHDGFDKFYSREEILDLEDSTLVSDTYETGTFLCPPNGEYFFACQLTSPANDFWTDGFVKTSPTSATWVVRHSGFDLSSQLCDDMSFRGSEHCDNASQFKYCSFFGSTASIKVIFHFLGFRDVGRNIV